MPDKISRALRQIRMLATSSTPLVDQFAQVAPSLVVHGLHTGKGSKQ